MPTRRRTLDEAGVVVLLEMCASPGGAEASGAADRPFGAQPGEPVPCALPAPWLHGAPPTPHGPDDLDIPRDEATPGEALVAGFGGPGGIRDSTAATLEALLRLAPAREDGEDAVAGAAQDSPAGGTALAEVRPGQRPATSEAAAPVQRPPELRAPIGTPAWTDELGSRVTWMVEQGEQVASLRLSPENLGPLEVRIAVREGETTVWFGAAQADTRAALEQSLPRLREMLGASGLALANAGVFSQTPRDPQRGFTAAALARASAESGAEPVAGTVTGITGRGLIDLYA